MSAEGSEQDISSKRGVSQSDICSASEEGEEWGHEESENELLIAESSNSLRLAALHYRVISYRQTGSFYYLLLLNTHTHPHTHTHAHTCTHIQFPAIQHTHAWPRINMLRSITGYTQRWTYIHIYGAYAHIYCSYINTQMHALTNIYKYTYNAFSHISHSVHTDTT